VSFVAECEQCGVIERGDQGFDLRVIAAAFDPERPLADRRQAQFGIEGAGDPLLEPEPLEPGHRQYDRIELTGVEFREAGVHVAAQLADPAMRERVQELARATLAAGADDRALGQLARVVITIGDKGVERALAFEDHGQVQPLREVTGHVLHRVHGDIGAAVQQALLQFLHEQSLAADRRQ